MRIPPQEILKRQPRRPILIPRSPNNRLLPLRIRSLPSTHFSLHIRHNVLQFLLERLDGPDGSSIRKVNVLETEFAGADLVKFDSDVELVCEVCCVYGLVGEEWPGEASIRTTNQVRL